MSADHTAENDATWPDPDHWPSTAEFVAATKDVPAGFPLCDCGVQDGTSEATNPDDRSEVLPHHFDCAAVTGWVAVKRWLRDAPMTNAERGDRLEAMLDRMAGKSADQADVIARVNTKVDDWLDRGSRFKDQDARAFSNIHALELIEVLRDFRTRVTPPVATEPGDDA